MRIIKKALSLLLVCAMALSMVACGNKGGNEVNIDEMTFEQLCEEAKGTTVTFYGWGGDELLNKCANLIPKTALTTFLGGSSAEVLIKLIVTFVDARDFLMIIDDVFDMRVFSSMALTFSPCTPSNPRKTSSLVNGTRTLVSAKRSAPIARKRGNVFVKSGIVF